MIQTARCRGFTHPFVLLVRSTLRSSSSLERTYSPSLLTDQQRYLRPFSSCHYLYEKKGKIPPKIHPTTSPKVPSKKPPVSTKLTVSPKPPQHPTTSRFADTVQHVARFNYTQSLLMKAKSTILYEAAPQTSLLISSYAAALFCLCSAGINTWLNVFSLPPGINEWVPVGFGVISIVFTGLATVFAMIPTSVIRSVKLIADKASQTAPNAPPKRALLEIAYRRNIPLPLPLNRIQVDPQHFVLVNRMQQRPVVLTREQLTVKKLQDEKRRKEERQYEIDHLMTAPFRDAGRASFTIFQNIRRGLTGEGFAPVYIKGKRYKLDIHGGYALENGQALDRLATIRPDPDAARMYSEEAKP